MDFNIRIFLWFFKFYYKYNRKYLKNSSYPLPCDIFEKKRINDQNWLIEKIVIGKKFISPIENILSDGISVLDYGCGTGVWTINMSKKYKKSMFYGIDRTLEYISYNNKENCFFIKDNILKNKNLNNIKYDFIYQRLLLISYKKDEWEKIRIDM